MLHYPQPTVWLAQSSHGSGGGPAFASFRPSRTTRAPASSTSGCRLMPCTSTLFFLFYCASLTVILSTTRSLSRTYSLLDLKAMYTFLRAVFCFLPLCGEACVAISGGVTSPITESVGDAAISSVYVRAPLRRPGLLPALLPSLGLVVCR